tara:strand:- start:1426 stop:2403 length:978 start_codon:yes stop_codon:yes gene_type:complete
MINRRREDKDSFNKLVRERHDRLVLSVKNHLAKTQGGWLYLDIEVPYPHGADDLINKIEGFRPRGSSGHGVIDVAGVREGGSSRIIVGSEVKTNGKNIRALPRAQTTREAITEQLPRFADFCQGQDLVPVFSYWGGNVELFNLESISARERVEMSGRQLLRFVKERFVRMCDWSFLQENLRFPDDLYLVEAHRPFGRTKALFEGRKLKGRLDLMGLRYVDYIEGTSMRREPLLVACQVIGNNKAMKRGVIEKEIHNKLRTLLDFERYVDCPRNLVTYVAAPRALVELPRFRQQFTGDDGLGMFDWWRHDDPSMPHALYFEENRFF